MSIPVTGVSELVLEVRDLDASERFYVGVLGLPVVERWPEREAIWVLAGKRTRIGLWRPQLGVAGGRGGAHVHFALHLADDDFDAAIERLRAGGLAPHVVDRRSRTSRAGRSAYVDDPDGNCVELWTRDVFANGPQTEAERDAVEHFDASAERWDREYDEPTLRGHWWRTRLERVLELVGGGPGQLLEVGVGSGRLLAELAARGWSVTGVDPASEMVRHARGRLRDSGELFVARAEELPFPDDCFDVVVGIGVLEYTDFERALRELARVLRPDGRAIIGLRNGSAPTVIWHSKVALPVARRVKRLAPFGRPLPQPRRAPLPRDRALALLAAAGFAVEHIEQVGCAIIPDPFDGLAARAAYAAARSAERSPLPGRIFGTQRLIVAVSSHMKTEPHPSSARGTAA